MKKALSVLLCVSLLFSLSSLAFAQAEKESPVLFVAGMNTCDLIYLDDGTKAFPPTSDRIKDSIVSAIIPLLVNGILMRSWDGAAKALCKAANGIFEPCKMKPNTTSLYNVGAELPDRYTTSAERYENGEEYFFTYDWRFSPLDTADILNDYINGILENTGCEKIRIYSHSMGSCVLLSYLEKYGHDKVEKLLFTDSAFQGMDFVGELFSGKVYVNPESLTNYVCDLVYGTDYAWVGGLMKFLKATYFTDGVCKLFNDVLVKNMIDTICVEMRDFVFMLPGIWSFCPAKDYAACRKFVFGDTPAEEYRILVEKNDYYINNVQSKIKDILDSAMADGVSVSILAAYDRQGIPIVSSSTNQSDGMVDVKHASIGATAAPLGKTLGDNYKQIVTACGHNHLSADLVIDASTCMYPEYTWFIRGVLHHIFGADIDAFCDWILNYDGQPTIFDNPQYPQFLTYDRDTEKVTILGTAS
ncbi:MAG: hypothetical protein IJU96_10620 [Clostridia bacterium]|nr:hypothetical protein [Clostridia bacterium]